MSEAIRRVLLRSSAGNFESNLSDLRTLYPISTTLAESSLTEYEKESGRKVLSTTLTSVDHENLKNINLRLEEYLKKNETQGVKAGVQVVKVTTDSYDIIVYAERADLKNCYSGSWKGHFHVECNKTAFFFSGNVQVSAQVFENDHVQLSSELKFPSKKIEVSRIDEDVSMALIQELEKVDSQVIQSMEGLYENISGDLKSLRKAIPVTRTKFDWNVNSSRFRRTLSDSVNMK